MSNEQVKAFISYSWSSPEHQSWVMDIATRLMGDGIEVILDKWDLQVGHDALAFMERIVTDKTVTKVLIVSDRLYTERANDRSGGVGRETQILTPEIYSKTDQGKYAALITERDEVGKAYVPAFYGGRIFIDFTQPGEAEARYEELVRWIMDKPRHIKPRLGKLPAFITKPHAVASPAASKLLRAEDAVKKGAPATSGLIREYAEALIEDLQSCQPTRTDGEPWDETVFGAVEVMRERLKGLNQLILTVARAGSTNEDVVDAIIATFEQIAQLTFRPLDVRSWSSDSFDAYKMFTHEAFLCLIAILIAEQKFELVGRMINHRYYVDSDDISSSGPATISFRVFCQLADVLDQRNRRLELNRRSMSGHVLSEAYASGFPAFRDIIQADLVLYLASEFAESDDSFYWYPSTLVYASMSHRPLPLFARSESGAFFLRWTRPVFGEILPVDFREKMTPVIDQTRHLHFRGLNVARLINLEHLSTKP